MIGKTYFKLESARNEGSLRMKLGPFEIRNPFFNIKTSGILGTKQDLRAHHSFHTQLNEKLLM